MSLTSLENYCEQIEIILLQAQAALSGFQIVREMEDSAADKDRIVVKSSPREVALYGINQSTPVAWRFPVTVTLKLATRSKADFDTCIAAIEAANTGTPPSSAVTLATTAFPSGVKIENTDQGEVAHGDNVRERTKAFNFIAVIPAS